MKLRDNQALRDEVRREIIEGYGTGMQRAERLLDIVDRALTATGPGSGARLRASLERIRDMKPPKRVTGLDAANVVIENMKVIAEEALDPTSRYNTAAPQTDHRAAPASNEPCCEVATRIENAAGEVRYWVCRIHAGVRWAREESAPATPPSGSPPHDFEISENTGHGAGQGPEQAARARAGSETPSPVRREPGDQSPGKASGSPPGAAEAKCATCDGVGALAYYDGGVPVVECGACGGTGGRRPPESPDGSTRPPELPPRCPDCDRERCTCGGSRGTR